MSQVQLTRKYRQFVYSIYVKITQGKNKERSNMTYQLPQPSSRPLTAAYLASSTKQGKEEIR